MKKKRSSESGQRLFKSEPKTHTGKIGENSKVMDKGKGIQCHECEGFGHVQRECPNFLRKQKKSYVAQHSDSDSEGNEDDQVNCLAFSAKTERVQDTDSSSESDTDTEITEETIAEKYKSLFESWEKLMVTNQKLKGDKAILIQKVNELEESLSQASDELKKAQNEAAHLSKYMNMMTKGTSMLDDLIGVQRNPNNKSGLGFQNQSTKGEFLFVPEQKKITMAPDAETNWTKDTRVCNHCHQPGHIMRKCKVFLSKYRKRDARESLNYQIWQTKRNPQQIRRPEQKDRVLHKHQKFHGNPEVCNYRMPDYYHYTNPHYECFSRSNYQKNRKGSRWCTIDKGSQTRPGSEHCF